MDTSTNQRSQLEVERPLFVIAAPRSGSSMLFEALARSNELWTLGGEAHSEFESVPRWRPADRGYDSNRLTAEDYDPTARPALMTAFAVRLRNSAGIPWRLVPLGERPNPVRLLEKTPKNSLRVPLLRALFPDARFVFLWREPQGSVASIMEAWRSGRFVTYPRLPKWSGLPWSLLLIPGWRALAGASLEVIASHQWRVANEVALDDLEALPEAYWCAIEYGELVAAPDSMLRRLCEFAGLSPTAVASAIPIARHTITPPEPTKWRTYRGEIEGVLPGLLSTWKRLAASTDRKRFVPQ